MAARALCVGINEFANLPTNNWLNGCVNDANDVAAMLRRYGFTGRNTTVLTDAAATKAAIFDALSAMVDKARAGSLDHLVFAYSSHGTQVPDEAGGDAEGDGYDEAFAAYDLRSSNGEWDRKTLIVDDELNALLGSLPKEVLVEVVLDTCHSGSGLKAPDLAPGRKPKFLTPPTPKAIAAVSKSDPTGLQELVKTTKPGFRPVLFAACRANQVASDAYFDGRYNGAFTYYFLKALKTGTTQSRKTILDAVAASLKGGSFDQRAQLEGVPKAKAAAFGANW